MAQRASQSVGASVVGNRENNTLGGYRIKELASQWTGDLSLRQNRIWASTLRNPGAHSWPVGNWTWRSVAWPPNGQKAPRAEASRAGERPRAETETARTDLTEKFERRTGSHEENRPRLRSSQEKQDGEQQQNSTMNLEHENEQHKTRSKRRTFHWFSNEITIEPQGHRPPSLI
jgi:hypothetical protein